MLQFPLLLLVSYMQQARKTNETNTNASPMLMTSPDSDADRETATGLSSNTNRPHFAKGIRRSAK